MTRIAHYVKPNEQTRVPRRHVVLDTESHEHTSGTDRVQTFRLAVAHFWNAEPDRKHHEKTQEYDDPDTLWRDVAAWTRRRSRTVLWAHNLGYDVRIAESLTALPRLGWSLVAHNLQSRGAWFEWRNGDRTLVMVDTASIWGVTLAQVGECFGLGKVPLPQFSDDRDNWLARCKRDVEITVTAVKAYLDWIEEADLGNWQLTGAGQSWAAWRHRFMSHQVLVHDDPAALAAERRGMWTGRCEAYWHGALSYQVLHEWDMHLCYARIATETAVPTKLIGPVHSSTKWQRWLDHPHIAILGRVRVRTDVPVVPAEIDGRIAWPVGEFETVLWGPEISEAIREGAQVELLEGWIYRTAPALADMARWIIDQLGQPDDQCPAWRKIILKHWARAYIGRFAMTHQSWEHIGTTPILDTRRIAYYDTRTQTESELLQVGHELFDAKGVVEWDQSCPAVTGYVMAVARVRLWRIIRAAPREAILYCDTDSIFVTDRFHAAIKSIAESPLGAGLRLKRSWDGFAIWGPRQITTGALVRVAGIPKRATRTGRHTFTGEVWESLETATKHGRTDRVKISGRNWTMKGVDKRRTGPPVGWTKPIRV